MSSVLKTTAVCFVVFLFGCRDPEIDGKIVVLDSGRVIELQRRLGDTYLAHELDVKQAEKVMGLLKGEHQ